MVTVWASCILCERVACFENLYRDYTFFKKCGLILLTFQAARYSLTTGVQIAKIWEGVILFYNINLKILIEKVGLQIFTLLDNVCQLNGYNSTIWVTFFTYEHTILENMVTFYSHMVIDRHSFKGSWDDFYQPLHILISVSSSESPFQFNNIYIQSVPLIQYNGDAQEITKKTKTIQK